MKIIVKAKPNSKKVFVEKITQPTLNFEKVPTALDIYRVSVKEPATEGKANKAIIEAIARYFDVAPSLVEIVSGTLSKEKVVEIDV